MSRRGTTASHRAQLECAGDKIPNNGKTPDAIKDKNKTQETTPKLLLFTPAPLLVQLRPAIPAERASESPVLYESFWSYCRRLREERGKSESSINQHPPSEMMIPILKLKQRPAGKDAMQLCKWPGLESIRSSIGYARILAGSIGMIDLENARAHALPTYACVPAPVRSHQLACSGRRPEMMSTMTTMESEWRLAAHILLLSAAIGGITYLLHRALRSFHLRQENRSPPPGGIGSWCRGFVGAETLSFLADNSSGRGFYHFVHTRALRYGACFRTSLFGRTHVFLLSAKARAAAACLLAADPPHFAKRYVRTVADLLGEHSLLCTSHDTHRRMRRAVAGLFASASTAAFAETFDRLTTSQLLAAHFQDRVVVLDVALDVTFRAICEMLIGPQDDSQKLERLQSDVMDVTQAMLAVPLRLPGTRFYKGLQARKRIMDVLRQEISMRRQSSLKLDRRDDFLQTLLLKSHTDAPEEALTDEQILDNILTLIIAGQVTTATAITWMIKYLGDNTDLQEKLRSVQLDLASKHHGSPLTLQHLNTMDYAYKTVKESLRMATIVSWFPRVALKDCQVAGFHIKKDWIVNVDARSIHYDPTIYHNPTMFDPSRFNDDMKPYSFLVFGAGGRTCLGMNLAKIMMLIFLHRLVTNFRWEMADHDTSLERWAMFPRLKNGCPICLTPIHKKMY